MVKPKCRELDMATGGKDISQALKLLILTIKFEYLINFKHICVFQAGSGELKWANEGHAALPVLPS